MERESQTRLSRSHVAVDMSRCRAEDKVEVNSSEGLDPAPHRGIGCTSKFDL